MITLSTRTLMLSREEATQAEVNATGKRWCSGCQRPAPAQGGKKKNTFRWLCMKCWNDHLARKSSKS